MAQLTMQDISELKAEGYSESEIQQAVLKLNKEEMQNRFQQVNTQNQQQNLGTNSTFQYNPSDNLIKWQLELNDILERAEHILKEDVVTVVNGNIIWESNPKPGSRIFNDYGVQEIMRILSMYVNRNTILSDYEPEEIKYKVYDFGKEVNDLIFMKYESFGLTDQEKRKNYPMLARQLIDIVHSAYKRAQYGKERESLRTARQISQQENLLPPNINVQTGEMRKERGFMNPARFVLGKYK